MTPQTLLDDYRTVFSTPQGQNVLADIAALSGFLDQSIGDEASGRANLFKDIMQRYCGGKIDIYSIMEIQEKRLRQYAE